MKALTRFRRWVSLLLSLWLGAWAMTACTGTKSYKVTSPDGKLECVIVPEEETGSSMIFNYLVPSSSCTGTTHHPGNPVYR